MPLASKIVTLCFPATCLGCRQEIPPYQPVRILNSIAGNGPPSHASTNRDTEDSPSTSAFDFESVFGSHWCSGCWEQLDGGGRTCCPKCHARLHIDSPFSDGCSLCVDLNLRYDRAVAIGNYQGLLQALVIQMKNQHDEQLATQLGIRLAYELTNMAFLHEIDLIVPVPTHWWRHVRRGFRASEVISESVAAACNLPRSSQAVRCVRRTRKQGTLSAAGRFDNVRGAFAARSRSQVRGLTILVIDDVMTSGATTSEMARVLLSQGASKVYVGVIARGARVS